jgi:hypothetical protein
MSARPTQQYYRPYEPSDSGSSSGSGSDSESDSWYSSSGSDQAPPPKIGDDGLPNFRAFASQLQLRDAGGPPFSTPKDQLKYNKGGKSGYSEFTKGEAPLKEGFEGSDTEDTAASTTQQDIPYGKTEFKTSTVPITSLIMVDSKNRDRNVYPQPTLFRIRLPKVYRNVINIQLQQVNLLTSFYYFRPDKENISITILEKDRITLSNTPNIIINTITTGSYNIDSLLTEIQRRLNTTPIFYYFKNGFDDFINIFRTTGDFSLNFNQPGDNLFDASTQSWIATPSMNQITSQYWQTQFAGLSSYTTNQVLLAYYYPVLWQVLYDPKYGSSSFDLTAGLGIDPTVTTTEEVAQRILYQFQGLSDPVVTAVVLADRIFLEEYRTRNTFLYTNINQYSVTRGAQTQQVSISTKGLNTSLVTLITSKQSQYGVQALSSYGITLAQYTAISITNQQSLAVLQGMYNFLQSNFVTYFAVPWSQYSLAYYANLDWTLFLRDGLNAIGIPTTDVEALNAGIIQNTNNILLTQKTQPNYYWPYMSSLSNTTVDFVNLSNATSTLNYIYNVNTGQFNTRHTIVDSNNILYSEPLTKTANAVCPITAGKYTVFKFQSHVRQTIQVETLPRPTAYRIPLYNSSNYSEQINQYFDMSYSFITPPNQPLINSNYSTIYDTIPIENLSTIPGWYSNVGTWLQPFAISESLWTTCQTVNINSYQRAYVAEFVTPYVSSISDSQNSNSNYKYTLNLTTKFFTNATGTITAKAPQNFQMFLYHDRAAFQADVNFVRNESRVFYLQSTLITSEASEATIDFNTYPNQRYYVLVRADNITFPTVNIKVFPWFNTNNLNLISSTRALDGIDPSKDPFSNNFSDILQKNWNYAQVYDTDFIQLPVGSNIWSPDDPTNANATQNYGVSNTPMGYDTNGVSTDYSDYIPFVTGSYCNSFDPGQITGIDPINQYQFQQNSPYDTITQTYYPGCNGNNAIFTRELENIYTPGTVLNRERVIAHYYSLNYFAEPDIRASINSLVSPYSTAQLPYTTGSTQGAISNYVYGGGTQSTIQLGSGTMGFTILPIAGVWDFKRLVFRSAIQDFVADPNAEIQYIGVYNMGDLYSTNTNTISMSTAIFLLSTTARVTYTETGSVSYMGGISTLYAENTFDLKGGTYYEFQKDNNFQANQRAFLQGYRQKLGHINTDADSIYTAIAFNQYGAPITIKALSGSTIPYPLYNVPRVSTCYLDGTSTIEGKGLVVPSSSNQTIWSWVNGTWSNYAPSPGVDKSQSQFAQSIPIGTTAVNYKQPFGFTEDPNYLQQWEITQSPTNVVATVCNYILFRNTNFYIYPYDINQQLRSFSQIPSILTPDQIYPSYENTSLVGVAGNSSGYIFLGFSNTGTSNVALRFKKFTPSNNELSELPTSGTLLMEGNGLVNRFTFNDLLEPFLQYAISYWIPSLNSARLYVGNLEESPEFYPIDSNIIHSMDPTGSILYYMTLDSNNFGSNLYSIPMGSYPSGYISYTLNTSLGLPSSFIDFTVTNSNNIPGASNDELMFITSRTGFQSNVYLSSNWSGTSFNIARISTVLTEKTASVSAGYKGSLWITSQTGLWANRRTEVDTNGIFSSAWQIFYPFQKVVLQKMSNYYNSIPNLTNLEYPEYPHSAIFFYNSTGTYLKDTNKKWGQESSNNFITSDPNMTGYYFNAYNFNAPVQATTNSNDYNYITIRGYTPTENSETLVRFYLPNLYDFGYITPNNLINEINLFSNTSASNYSNTINSFDSRYLLVLSTFNFAFNQSNNYFGLGYINGFQGSNIQTTGFPEFMSNYSTIYQGYQSNANLISGITGYINQNTQNFITTDLTNVLPFSAISRENFVDPLTFSILWKSGLSPNYLAAIDNWGLGYNLGYAKQDTPYSVTARAQSFYKILDDYIYLRLNPEHKMNMLDFSAKEDLSITRDSTGQVQYYYGKLLLNNFNSFSQTMVTLPVQLTPPIGKLEQLYFQWTDANGTQINNADCEWSVTVQIVENRVQATTDSTIPAIPAIAKK